MQKVGAEKTAFSPRPGYGLWEFVVVPYGLTRATQTCQCFLNELLWECYDYVDNYVDVIIIFLDDMNSHKADLRWVLENWRQQDSSWKNTKLIATEVWKITLMVVPERIRIFESNMVLLTKENTFQNIYILFL